MIASCDAGLCQTICEVGAFNVGLDLMEQLTQTSGTGRITYLCNLLELFKVYLSLLSALDVSNV